MVGGILQHQIDETSGRFLPQRTDTVGHVAARGRDEWFVRASPLSPVGVQYPTADHLSGGLFLQGLPLLFSHLVKADRDCGLGMGAPAPGEHVEALQAAVLGAFRPVRPGRGRIGDRQLPRASRLVGHFTQAPCLQPACCDAASMPALSFSVAFERNLKLNRNA